ncbi:MAG TPA: TIM-barrel domain-containing protein, partial [Verrucomicrobiae bacterium]
MPQPKSSAVFIRLCLALALSATAIAANAAQPKVDQIAPGIWRLRFGTPEKFTPTHFRSAEPAQASLAALPATATLPLDLNQISCQISARGCALLLPMEPNESIYGLGLHTELFDLTQSWGQAGRRVSLKPTDAPENDRGESHAPVPFYVSSTGYGVFVDTARAASFYTGNVSPLDNAEDNSRSEVQTTTTDLYHARVQRVKTMLVDVPVAQGVDVYVFAGPAMLTAVQRYNLFSGGGTVPPLWGLGIHYRGYAKLGADDSLALATRLRADHMPCDVWGIEPGWQTATYSCSFVWNTNLFAQPDAFIARMQAQGFKLNFWEHAFTHPSSPIYAELKPWAGNFRVWNGLVP